MSANRYTSRALENSQHPSQARKAAKRVLGAVEDGKDPLGERIAARGVRTFKDVAGEYMQLHVRPKRKARTAAEK